MSDDVTQTPEQLQEHTIVEPSILYFGTPVVLISSRNEDGTANLAPMSSAWALGYTVVLGLGSSSHTLRNLERERECVLSLPSPQLWRCVERLAPLTGADPVPDSKQPGFRHESKKFEAAGLSPQPSQTVTPPRVRECPIQLEARVVAINTASGRSFAIIETQIQRVHVARHLLIGPHDHIDPRRWSPLIYNFRHYIAADTHLGATFRAEV